MSALRTWTLELLRTCSDEEFPRTGFKIRMRKKETIEQWRARLIDAVETKYVSLTPKSSPARDAYGQRPTEVLIALERFGVETEADQRVFAEPALTPSLSSYVNDTERYQAALPEEEYEDMFDIRLRMFEWVQATWDLKFEEARCDLRCLTCPSGQALACATENMVTATVEGFDLSTPVYQVGAPGVRT